MDLGDSGIATYTFLFKILETYQNRNLTSEDDALNAMTGILRRVSAAADTEMIQGHPAKIFPLALIFIQTSTRAPQRRKNFPSWSWAGWAKGEPSWYAFDTLGLLDGEGGEEELDAACQRTWISYQVAESDGTSDPEPFWSPSALATEGLEGLIHSFPTLDLGQAGPNTSPALKQQLPSAVPQQCKFARPYPLLKFSTWLVRFRLRTIPDDSESETDEDKDEDGDDGEDEISSSNSKAKPRPTFQSYTSRTYEICSPQNHDVGTIYADIKLLLEDDNIMDFVVLGECYNVEYPLEFDLDCEFKSEESVVWVMLVRDVGGVWERRGIGQVLSHKLKDGFGIEQGRGEGMEWREILLG
jgi:hypothetical protein